MYTMHILNMSSLITFISLSMLTVSANQISTPESLTYTAAVVEYHVNQGSSSLTNIEKFQRNADKYIQIMYSPEASNVDIILFPESCLNSPSVAVIIPREIDDIDLCTNTSYEQNLRNIACAARDLRKYVVINLTMKRNCSVEREMGNDCTSEWVLYNTNVVFDRDGKVISIYRKYNLFGERGITQPTSPDISKFSTDFNVTFGHFTCFDLQFQSPALDLVKQGIRDIIFPTMWYSELPFLTAVQLQQNWAQVIDVNFLGAGASTGSGIYSGKLGALISIMTGEETTRLLVHEVPKIPGTSITMGSPAYSGANFDRLKLWRDQLDVYISRKIELPVSVSTPLSQSLTLCHKFQEEFCCDFEVEVALQNVAVSSVRVTRCMVSIVELQYSTPILHRYTGTYYAVVFSGVRSFSALANGGIQTCGVIACLNNDISTCGTILSMLNNEATKNVTMSLLTPKSDLLTFAIYSRDFRLTSSSNKVTSTVSVVLIYCISVFIQ